MKTKVKSNSTIKVKVYNVMSHAVEEGVLAGWNRAHKHSNSPDKNAIIEHIYNEVMNSICEWFDFEDMV